MTLVVVNALFMAIPNLRNVLLVCILFFLVFSILFVNLLKVGPHRSGGHIVGSRAQMCVRCVRRMSG